MDERHEKILGEGFEQNFNPDIWGIRVNTILNSVEDFKKRFEDLGYNLIQVPWCKEGFCIETKDILTRTKDYKNGQFFSQNASSMFPPMVLDPTSDDYVLDMTASPGSKTTQMAAMMNNQGILVANDIEGRRILALKSNIQRCGIINVAVTRTRGEYYWKKEIQFDKILLDAPCTGTGTMKPGILEATSMFTIKRIARKQKILLKSAADSLKNGGTLVYSTCSLEPEENEAIINYGIEELGLEVEKIDTEVPKEKTREIFTEWEGKTFNKDVCKAIRLMPTENTEGFFICKLKR